MTTTDVQVPYAFLSSCPSLLLYRVFLFSVVAFESAGVGFSTLCPFFEWVMSFSKVSVDACLPKIPPPFQRHSFCAFFVLFLLCLTEQVDEDPRPFLYCGAAFSGVPVAK